MFVSDIKENYMDYGLPYEFAECLPEYCEEEGCGAPLEISETLTGLHCSNPRCRGKLVVRIRTICKSLGILDFGESTIEKFIDYYGVTNALDIYELQLGMVLGEGVSLDFSNKIIKQIIEKKEFLLWEYVMHANLPYLQTSSRDIFQGYDTLEEAYKDIELGGVDFIQSKLGIGVDGVSVRAVKIYNSLIEFKDDLLEGERHVCIKYLGDVPELNIVCSDQVGGGFDKKSEFYAYVNNEFNGRVHVNFLGSVTKNINYLVWKGADGSPARYTSKVQKVEGYNSKGGTIPILTATQLIEELNRLY